MNIKDSLILLNIYLSKKGAKRSFIICGGASLVLQGIIYLILLKPSLDELNEAIEQTLGKDQNQHWPEWVNKQGDILKKELGYE